MQKKDIEGINKKGVFTNCLISEEQTEGRLISVNKKYLAMAWKKDKNNNEGEIVVVDSSNPTNIKIDLNKLKYNNKKIYDLEFSPFNNNILASCHEDKTVRLWKIPENGIYENITNTYLIYNNHNNKVNFVNFNPISSDVICSSTHDGEIHVWNLENKNNYINLKVDYNPTPISWNPNGSLIGAITRFKNINFFDPRDKNIIIKKVINEYSRPSKFDWTDDYSFSNICWDKTGNNRMLKLWDIKKLDKEIMSIKTDTSMNVCIPFADRELKLIYTLGKEEKPINVYD